VQGRIGSQDFLVTCPVNLYSTARVELRGLTARALSSSYPDPFIDVRRGVPGEGWKTRLAVARTLEFLGFTAGEVWVEVDSPIPMSKGMASSSADISAASWATALALGVPITPWQVARVALSIEPTDGVMFQGCVIFDHRRGRCVHSLGQPPPMRALVVETGGEVDTLRFNAREDLGRLNAAKEHWVGLALTAVVRGVLQSHPALVAWGATASAMAHQAVLEKRLLEELVAATAPVGALGVSVAHSGSVIGVLLPCDGPVEALARTVERVGAGKPLGVYNLVGGGVRDGSRG
jgi:L-threonine kinase